MSGICIAVGTEDADQRLDAMLQQMSGFGQSVARISLCREIACGRAWHARLASEHSPAVDDGRIVVLVDGEIFSEDGPLEKPEDMVRNAYREDDLETLAHMNGSFSAIIVDQLQNRVVLASDRFGSRPLFVWWSDSQLAAASRLDALLTDDRVPRRISRQGIVELVALQRTTEDQTHYSDVKSTVASEIWDFSNGRATRYRTRRLAWQNSNLNKLETTERLTAGLRNAARRRTADSVRHGILLSGGLDARMVLAATNREGRNIPCLTIGPYYNNEVLIAETVAKAVRAEFRYFENPPANLFDVLDAVTRASDGLFTASCNLFGQLQEMAKDYDVLLSGHGLDYTLRGYYLPCRAVTLAGSRTRLPSLRPIRDGSAQTIVENMRVGISEQALRKVFVSEVRDNLLTHKVRAVDRALESVETESPYDAWDAYILSCLGRHYAYSDFTAMEAVIAHRCLTFDPDVFDVYLGMSPEWRASGEVARAAMIALSPNLMAIPDANTGYSPDRPFAMQTAMVIGRAFLRRLKRSNEPDVPDTMHTHGSWANYGEVMRHAPKARQRVEELSESEGLLDTGLFSREGIAQVAAEHLCGQANHLKLLMQLLTLASWLNVESPNGTDHDA